MTSPGFIIHAAGSRGNVPDLGKRSYRLKFSVVTWPNPTSDQLRRGLYKSLEPLERQMRTQGFELRERTIRFERRQPHIETVEIHVHRQPTAKQMIRDVAQGAKFRDQGGTIAMAVPLLEETEAWEYIFSAEFIHDTLVFDIPEVHEEGR